MRQSCASAMVLEAALKMISAANLTVSAVDAGSYSSIRIGEMRLLACEKKAKADAMGIVSTTRHGELPAKHSPPCSRQSAGVVPGRRTTAYLNGPARAKLIRHL